MHRRLAFSFIAVFVPVAFAQPPTPGPDTTFYEAPLDEEGYVDYVAALNAEFNDPPVKPETNAFLGILNQVDTTDWPEGHIPALYSALGVEQPNDDRQLFITFMEYADVRGLPQAPPFDWENAAPDEEPPPPPAGTADAMEERAYSKPWTAEELPEVARWLDSIEVPLDAIVEATKLPTYYAPLVRPHEYATMIEILLPHLGTHRAIGRSLSMRARMNLAVGNLDAAIDDWAAIKRLGRLQKQEPFLICNLVGISLQPLSHDLLALILSQPGIEAQHIQEMRDIMNRLPTGESMARVIQRCERVMPLDLLTRASRGQVDALEMIQVMQSLVLRNEPVTYAVRVPEPDPLTGLISDPKFDLDRALRRGNAAWVGWFGDVPDDYQAFAASVQHIEADIHQRSAAAMQQAQRLLQIGKTGIPESADIGLIVDQTADLILAICTPGFSAAIRTERQSDAQASLEPTALALERYRLDRGQYPPLLQSLVPDYIEALPPDMFSNKSLRYRRDGAGYMLYSVGTNLVDDGGIHDFSDGDIVLRVPWSLEN